MYQEEKEPLLVRMKELVEILQEASKAYYANDCEIMSNFTYDKLYDELSKLEEETGVTFANSPTSIVGYEAVDELPKEAHDEPMLSLGKTKEREELPQWLQEQDGLLSWKLDGLTVVLTYKNGLLEKAVTRGNGEVGEVITNNARVFLNLPLKIPFLGNLVIRGEAVITYDDFEKINAQILEMESKDENKFSTSGSVVSPLQASENTGFQYKNPRNLCSGSVRQLNNEVTAQRFVRFYAFQVVIADQVDFSNSREEQLVFLKKQGFQVVDYRKVTAQTILENIEIFEKEINTYSIPSDGLVLVYDNISYGQGLGKTAKFPRDSIAFKWADEIKETFLLEVEWSPSRTGLINPVAIFQPVELEGTTVSRASLHNVSIVKGMKLGIGDKITVYKANMIIPQIAENLTKSDSLRIPNICPACGGEAKVDQINDVQSLYCLNPECSAKKIKAFTLFVSRNALNIDGLSEATLEKFIAKGFIHEFADIFHLKQYADEIQQMEGFGKKSYDNLIGSIEKARITTLSKVIYSLGIDNVGAATAKIICKNFKNDIKLIQMAQYEELSAIDGIGDVIATTFLSYMQKDKNKIVLQHLLDEIQLEEKHIEEEQILAGKVFVITGSLHRFENRNVLKEKIEQLGGKVTASVTGKTDVLINNDNTSQSSKNKKARELGITILTEEEFMLQFVGDL
ncbi:MAG: NAD-dependent DNA ligase LigA [Eubacteriales bacterium]